MQLILFLSMIMFAYVSSEEVACQMDFARSKDNEYIKIVSNKDYSIKEVQVLEEITQNDHLVIKYKWSNEDSDVLKQESVPLCHDNPNEAQRLAIHLLGKGLGLWVGIPCPVEPQTAVSPPRRFYEDYSFGESNEPGMLVDINLLKDKKSIVDISFTVLRNTTIPEDQ